MSVAIKPRLTVTTAEAAIDAATAGFGITRMLGYQVADPIAEGSLVRLLRDYEGRALACALALSKRSASGAEVARVRRFCGTAAAATYGPGDPGAGAGRLKRATLSIFPGRLALLEKRANSFRRVVQHHVLDHYG